MSIFSKELKELNISFGEEAIEENAFFSADRFERQIAERGDGGNSTSRPDNEGMRVANAAGNTTDILQIHTLIGLKSNPVLSEAKTLLNEWMRSDKVEISFEDEFKCYDKWISGSSSVAPAAETRDPVGRYIMDTGLSLIKEEKRVGAQNLGVSMLARQKMARERREILLEQKKLRELEAQRIALQRGGGRNRSSRESEKRERVAKQVVNKIVMEEVKESKEDIEKETEIARREAIIKLKKEELAEREASMKEAMDLKLIEERRVWLERACEKANELRQAKDLICKRGVFSAWLNHHRKSNIIVQKFQLKSNWKLHVSTWSNWKSRTHSRIEKRELQTLANEMRLENQKTIKAVRHDRLKVLSNALVAWRQWVELNRQDKLIKIAQERRALKMQQFLMQLEKRHLSFDLPIIPIAATAQPVSPVPVDTNAQAVQVLNPPEDPIIPTTKQQHKKLNNSYHPPSIESEKVKKMLIPKVISSIKPFKPTKKDQELVEAMQKRDVERLKRKELQAKEREEKRRNKELKEKEDLAEKNRLEQEESDRIVSERRRLEMEARLALKQKEQERQEFKLKLIKAREHYEHALMKNIGFTGMRKLVELHRDQEVTAENFLRLQLLRKGYHQISSYMVRKEEMMNEKAVKYHERKIQGDSLQIWRRALQNMMKSLETNGLKHDQRVLKSTWKVWQGKLAEVTYKRWESEREKNAIADQFASKALPRRFLQRWRDWVQEQKEERWREYRRNRLREAAKDVLTHSSLTSNLSTSSLADLPSSSLFSFDFDDDGELI